MGEWLANLIAAIIVELIIQVLFLVVLYVVLIALFIPVCLLLIIWEEKKFNFLPWVKWRV